MGLGRDEKILVVVCWAVYQAKCIANGAILGVKISRFSFSQVGACLRTTHLFGYSFN